MSEPHILVDGYNMIHQWDALRPARGKSLAAARQALIHLLTQFHDCRGGRLTVVFDGRSHPRGGDGIRTSIGVHFSKEGQSADAVIERLVGQSARPSDFLIATDDLAEQNIVESLGARSISADAFRIMIEGELDDMSRALEGMSSKSRHFGRRG